MYRSEGVISWFVYWLISRCGADLNGNFQSYGYVFGVGPPNEEWRDSFLCFFFGVLRLLHSVFHSCVACSFLFFFIKYNIIYNKKWKRNKEWLNEYGSTINVNCRAGGTDGKNAAYKGRPNQKRACLAVDPTRAFRVDYVPVGVHVVFTWCLSAPLF